LRFIYKTFKKSITNLVKFRIPVPKRGIGQGNRIIKPFKKNREEPTGKGRRGIMDIQTELALIPDPRIERCKKYNLPAMKMWFCFLALLAKIDKRGKTG
jgi:hypothetical protein